MDAFVTFFTSADVTLSNKLLEVVYILIGLVCIYTGVLNARDQSNEKRPGSAAFWCILGVLLVLGKWIPDYVAGALLIAMCIPPIIKQVDKGQGGAPTVDEMEGNFNKIGMKIFAPSLAIGVFALIFALFTKISSLVGLTFGVVVGGILLMAFSRDNNPRVFLSDCRRMLDTVGPLSMLPTLLAGLTKSFIQSPVVRNLFEGLLRIVIFLLSRWAVSHMKDVERMFAYHGAEHKTIFCYEKGLPLTVENVRPQSRFHPRCGTSFLFVVVIISILVFSLVSLRVGLWDNPWVRVGLRLLLLPVVVSISYEINRWVGRHDNLCSRILSAPGKWLQRLTTNEPDDSMIECAIRALELVIPEQKGSDAW